MTRKDWISMDDQLDVPLEDEDLLEEVDLVSTLMIAASEAEGPLDNSDIDRILGVNEEPEEG